jgi:hypothetical protein
MGKQRKIEFEITENGCFECTSHSKSHAGGYPRILKSGKRDYIHRHIYEECFGEIEKGQVVRHTCDNPMCINPEHLIIGTQRDNIQDMMDRDRNSFYAFRGDENGNSKLNEEKVKVIKQRLLDGDNPMQIALDNNVSYQTIYAISKGKAWKHVTI